MMAVEPTQFVVSAAEAGHTLAKVLRSRLGGPSWNEVRKLIAARRVKVGEAVCSDDARRLKEDEVVVLVEKPSGVNTVRHPAELEWSEQRRQLDPTLEDLTQWAIAHRRGRPAKE